MAGLHSSVTASPSPRRSVRRGAPIQIYEDESAGQDDRSTAGRSDHDGADEGDSGIEHDDHLYDDDGHEPLSEDSGSEGDPDEDPFSASEDGRLDEHDDHDTSGFDESDVVQSIEHDDSQLHHSIPHDNVSARGSHVHDQSFSRTTPIHIDDRRDPLLDYAEDNRENLRDASSLYHGESDAKLLTSGEDALASRKTSGSVISSLPDELEYYRSSLPGRSPLQTADRSSQHGSRVGSAAHDRQSVYSSTPRPDVRKRHEMSLSTPTAVPLPASPFQHSRSNSTMHNGNSDYHPVFRNPSSVRAMQLSSPSPPPRFESSPLSGRRMRHPTTHTPKHDSYDDKFYGDGAYRSPSHHTRGSPSRRTPSKRPAGSKKEYPLILLHCTLSLLPMPASFPTAALDAVGASERVKRDVALLNQNLDSSVLERGLLITHPGDDYELLEERILESLELRQPRVGGCGHFRSASGGSELTTRGDTVKATEQLDGTDGCPGCKDDPTEDRPHCEVCARRVSPAMLDRDEHDRRRRWDVRIFAANGLMRAGAWAAAWREMEKVDVEVGVWADDTLKRKLEEWAVETEREVLEAEESGALAAEKAAGEQLHDRAQRQRQPSDSTQLVHQVMQRVQNAAVHNSSPASRAPVSRVVDNSSSTHERTGSPERRRPSSDKKPASQHDNDEPLKSLPLSTLLFNHAKRQVHRNAELMLACAVVLLAVVLATRSIRNSAEQAVPNAEVAASANVRGVPQIQGGPGLATSGPEARDTVASTHNDAGRPELEIAKFHEEHDVEALLRAAHLSACTFPAGVLSGHDAAMTALPRSEAARVLASAAAMKADEETSKQNEDSGAKPSSDPQQMPTSNPKEPAAGAGAQRSQQHRDGIDTEHLEFYPGTARIEMQGRGGGRGPEQERRAAASMSSTHDEAGRAKLHARAAKGVEEGADGAAARYGRGGDDMGRSAGVAEKEVRSAQGDDEGVVADSLASGPDAADGAIDGDGPGSATDQAMAAAVGGPQRGESSSTDAE